MFQVGDWVEWRLPGMWLKQGEIVQVQGCSLEVQFLGSLDTTVFPVIEYMAGELVAVRKPPRASQIERDTIAGMMTPDRAAAILGIDLKRLRSLLRDGRLKGRREAGRWVEVGQASVEDLQS